MNYELLALAGTAASLGFIHTLIGPDHYLPFIAMAKVKNWSALRTAAVTFLCGVGHVLSSIVLGFIGIFFGVVVFKLEKIESLRGDLAAWLLIAFGLLYMAWGLHRAFRTRPHTHVHAHEDGQEHAHTHSHVHAHTHVHAGKSSDAMTPWLLFTVFVFGPCEPLIPLIMYPAARWDLAAVTVVALVFAAATILTMLACVMVCHYSLTKINIPRLERYSHALAGLAILMCGGAIKFLGL